MAYTELDFYRERLARLDELLTQPDAGDAYAKLLRGRIVTQRDDCLMVLQKFDRGHDGVVPPPVPPAPKRGHLRLVSSR